jgi:alkylation response protein AidB-like acyl-CoA dehydrogenase
MDLTLTDDQRLIQSTARDLLRSWADTAGARAVRGGGSAGPGYSTRLWKEMVELGWTGLAVPESYGGVGEGFLEACLLIEEMGGAGVPSPFLSTVACAGMPTARFGTEAQRAHWLGGIASGRAVAYLRAAPSGGWGSTGSDVLASEAPGGGFTLDGTAMFVPWAAAADGFLVAASTAAGLTVFLLDAATEGISIEPLEVIGPQRRYRVRFDRVGVGAGAVLGPVGGGREVVEAADAFGAAASCAEMVGGAQRVLELTVEYAGQRHQFGRPIGSFQAVQHHCADMAIDVLGSRLIGYEAIWRLSAGVDPPAEVALAVSAAKAWVSDAYQRVCALGQQVHGAIGFTEEHDLHLFTTHAMSTALSFGDGDFHTERVASALGLPGGDDRGGAPGPVS